MGVTVLTPAGTFRLTGVETARKELSIGSSDPDRLGRLIDAVSDLIVRTHLSFARQRYSEKLAGKGRNRLVLARTPIAVIESVKLDDSAITNFSVLDAEAGILYREGGWRWTIQTGFRDDAIAVTSPIPSVGFEQPDFTVEYSAGYLLPDDDRTGTTYSFATSDNSINDSGAKLPLLAAGDSVKVTGATNAANNKTFTVSTRTASKLVLTGGTLVTEAAGAEVKLAVRTLPYSVEQACLIAVLGLWKAQTSDPRIRRQRVGDAELEFGMDTQTGLPSDAVAILRPWKRAA